MNLVFLSALLAILPVQPNSTISSDSFEFRQIARLPYYTGARITCGDADHDGLQEFYAQSIDNPNEYILEFTPDMNYDTIRIPGLQWAIFWFIGDLDRDGKSDFGVDKTDNDTFFIYESADSASLPLQCVWQAQIGGITPYAIVTDLDRDSAQEIVLQNFDLPGSGISVFEYVADDSYAFRTVLPDTPHIGIYGFGSTPDVDRDGFPEIFKVGARVVGIYEAVGNDSFVITAVCSLPSIGPMRFGAVAGGQDIDRDGRTEAIAFAVDAYNMGVMAIYESSKNDSFEVVWHTYFPANGFSPQTLVTGDVDGDGVPEIAVSDGARIHLFRCTGNDQYEQFWQVYTGLPLVGLYDLNNDGKAEVICHDYTDDNHTTIYEYFKLGVSERQPAELQRVSIYPLFVAKGAVVRLSGLPPGTKIVILDASGRVIAKPEENAWHTTTATPGAYFVRIQLGNQSITHKVLVLK
ncbi:T9SS type A sorting domain-containing protein [candidate division WOR-3 bacterium]|nr:T9SS type A sorting domain-containing protein [candidate division WOR-3 bacterium]